ncbi:hypothetical protein OPV22_018628 [Ensete ventricosum]|uniref:Uncharacterized protein n=1 Tax=Ensete ventricosum TaxID=4639 RepID=A0AAV8QZ25_ENSVE|nr:hypothetical protein OPV22_018628 [Ensete ventricosum]
MASSYSVMLQQHYASIPCLKQPPLFSVFQECFGTSIIGSWQLSILIVDGLIKMYQLRHQKAIPGNST